jgi:hypothetical protein
MKFIKLTSVLEAHDSHATNSYQKRLTVHTRRKISTWNKQPLVFFMEK